MTTTKKAAPKKPAAKKVASKQAVEKPKKEHRFLRAFRVIADNPKSTPEAIAKKASLSVKMAGGCILAWNAAIQILGDKEVLAIDAAELAADLVQASPKAKAA
jgi:hypothetical protein